MNTLLLITYVCAIGALILTLFLQETEEKPMTVLQQYLRNARNLFINISAFALMGVATGVIINLLFFSVFEIKFRGKEFDFMLMCCSFLIFWFWPTKLYIETSTNQVLRTVNRLFTKQIILPSEQGDVEFDQAVIYRGPVFVIINIFDKILGFINTEVEKDIIIKIDELHCINDVGSAEVVVAYSINRFNTYASKGSDAKARVERIRTQIDAGIAALIESKTTGLLISVVSKTAPAISQAITTEFLEGNAEIELTHGITIRSVTLTKIDTSPVYKTSITSKGKTALVIEVAELIFTKGQESDPKISWEKSMENALILSENGTLEVRNWNISAEDLRNLQYVNFGGVGGGSNNQKNNGKGKSNP